MTEPTNSRQSVADWLRYLEQLHPVAIDLGLTRVDAVRNRMGLKLSCPVITIGGTNGKGSVCAFLSTILAAAGYRVGCYTSPHLLQYNERVAVDLQPIADADLVKSFNAVETGRSDTPLTYYEFGTLAAIWHFAQSSLDIAILEVGLGGRLDAVNAFDADYAAVVSVDLDHQSYLGDTREKIGFEKAGIYRTGKVAVCGDAQPPATLIEHADSIGAELHLIGRDFGFTRQEQQWAFWGRRGKHLSLPFPALRGAYQLSNASTALAILDELREQLPVGIGDIKRGLLQVEWPARFQVMPGRPSVILDVAHNPHAARALAGSLKSMGYYEQTFAVFSMLADKDMASVVAILKDQIDHWYIAPLTGPRSMSAEVLQQALIAENVPGKVTIFETISQAYRAACDKAGENDRIAAFGSFYTVAEVLQTRQSR
ncbi:bifunctional tetrahydrofolate synthase/dihydrofolate synthase [Chitinivorax sp. B]|uniref:bifunctional tetrahydrofolate synthase/dihydrofolate synthase n=1 Tax=Chitinivorax sp. B TaxID=2502235 RepID=UPI0010F6826E|nr:bifunctional tetrahydrofolate synthase/dihydrofolate synthase [Chitinivorax sp. B]